MHAVDARLGRAPPRSRPAPWRRTGSRSPSAASGTSVCGAHALRELEHAAERRARSRARARLARWIVGPSAIGSENGTPSSITSAPASAMREHERLASSRDRDRPPSRTGTKARSRRAPRSARRSASPIAAHASAPASARSRAQDVAHLRRVLVAAAREAHDRDGVAPEARRELAQLGDRVRRLERGEDALGAREPAEGVERLLVGHRGVCARARCRGATRARGRRPGSRGPRRSSGPGRSGRPRRESTSVRWPWKMPGVPTRQHGAVAAGLRAPRPPARRRRAARPRRRGTGGRARSRSSRRRRRRRARRAAGPRAPGSARAPRRRSRAGSSARASGTGAGPSPSRCSSRWCGRS